jgi:murein L,D-transpeptidase YafK
MRRAIRFRALLPLIALALVCCATADMAGEPPASDRSRKAIARVRPALEEALEKKGLLFGAPIFIRIFKQSRELELWIEKDDRFALFRSYDICSYSGRLGPKERRGDLQAPEGFYYVTPARMNPASDYHLSFNLGYPNAYDRAHGRTGSALMVHGDCVSIGCYAMTDGGIEEIYALADAALRNGQPFFRVHIFPFRMTAERMREESGSRWIDFWRNLKEGHDLFESRGTPPDVGVRSRRYAFQ